MAANGFRGAGYSGRPRAAETVLGSRSTGPAFDKRRGLGVSPGQRHVPAFQLLDNLVGCAREHSDCLHPAGCGSDDGGDERQ